MAEQKENQGESPPRSDASAPKPETEGQGGQYKRLYRSTTNRMIAGICGGIGEYFNVDPTLIRILLVVSVVAGGFGILAYIIAWIIIPEGRPEGDVSISANRTPLLGIIIGTLLVIIGIGLILERMPYWYFPDWIWPFFSIRVFFAFALIILGSFFILYVFKRNGNEITATGTATGEKRRATLYRSRTNKKISGVCGGLGDYLKFDPNIVRVLWVVVTLSTGLIPGLLVYFILAIVMPEEPIVEGTIQENTP